MKQPIVVFCISLLLLVYSVRAFPNQTGEIQVLIDVSGSMKQNDPKNLRTSATQLLINLLPTGIKASLWLFSEQTQLLSHTDAIDDEWRKQALTASRSIHSRGVYTDIEKAIDTVLNNGFANKENNNLILLTDGMVDISKDIMISADSRERILSEWIPRLRERQIKVQTIALSDQADRELLEKLAFDTDGWNETAESAEQLQRLFLKMAQKAVPKDTVPLQGNRFTIDSHIQEFSVLVFKKPNAAATQLIAPDQQKVSKENASNNSSWLDTPSYDLITIRDPVPGDWQIDAAIDPDNQVMILTDLKLQVNGMSNFIGEQDKLALRLYFTEQDKLISRRDFLDLVKVSLSIDDQVPENIPLSPDQPGYFVKSLTNLGKGVHHLSIIADGETFKREISRDFEVVSSPILVEKLIDTPNRQVTLKFVPDITVLDSTSLSIVAVVHPDNEAPKEQAVLDQNGEWLLKLNSLPINSSVRIHFNMLAKTIDGNAITPALAPITIDESLFSAPQPENQPDANETSSEHLSETVGKPENAQRDLSTDNANNWGLVVGIVVVVNILLAGIGFFVYKTLKSATTKKQQQILERLA